MSAMECPACHADVDDDVGTCPECGTVFEHVPTVTFVPVPPAGRPSLTPADVARLEGISGFGLVVERGPRAGMTWVIRDGVTTVGRHPDSDIFLDDITVSRHHCRFVVGEGGLEVEDSGSTNGTYVNGSRVDRTRLDPGDEIFIGKFHLIVAVGHD